MFFRHQRARSSTSPKERGGPQQAERLGRAQQLSVCLSKPHRHVLAIPAQWRGSQRVNAQRSMEAVNAATQCHARLRRSQPIAQPLACDAQQWKWRFQWHEDGRKSPGHTTQVSLARERQQNRYTHQGMIHLQLPSRVATSRMHCELLQRLLSPDAPV